MLDTIYNNFTRTYSLKNTNSQFKYPTFVRFDGTVVAFVLVVQGNSRQICYTVLNQTPTSQDTTGWSETVTPVPFPKEVSIIGGALLGTIKMPRIKNDPRQTEVSLLQQVRDSELSAFYSTTARLTADAPFQVLADSKYIYVIRQSIANNDPNIIYETSTGWATTKADNSAIVKDNNGQPIAIVNNQLLVDRFLLVGNNSNGQPPQLQPMQEVRYQRSQQKSIPAGSKDSLNSMDINGNAFYEPTHLVYFINNLEGGKFTAVNLPTQVANQWRWQFFTYNSKTQNIDVWNVAQDPNGAINTMGDRYYTSPDPRYQKSVLERIPGTDPFTGSPLISVDTLSDAENLVAKFNQGNASNTNIELKNSDFTLEFWLCPQSHQNNSQWLGAVNHLGGFYFHTDAQGKIYVGVDPANSLTTDEGFLELNKWQHFAFSYNLQTHQGILYKNGQNIVQKDDLGTPSQNWGGFGVSAVDGQIAEIRLWNYVRNPQEIALERSTRLVGNEPKLVGYWRCEQQQGNQIYDETNNSYHLVPTRNRAWDWVSAKFPLHASPGLDRIKLHFENVEATAGMSASLYYVQETPNRGTPSSNQAIKTDGRVLLAIALNNSSPVVLDWGVNVEGKLARAPEAFALAQLNKSGAIVDVGQITDIQTQIETLQQEISTLTSQLQEQKKLQVYPDWLTNITPNPTYQDLINIDECYKLVVNLSIPVPIKDGDYQQEYGLASVICSVSKSVNDDSNSGQYYWLKTALDFTHSTYSGQPEMKWSEQSNFSYYRPSGQTVLYIDDNLVNQFHQEYSRRRGILSNLESVDSNISSIEPKLQQDQQQLEALKQQLSQALSAIEGNIPLPIIYTDPYGLTVQGGIVNFAPMKVAPYVFELATGKIGIYFQGTDSAFQSLYLDVASNIRAQWSLTATQGTMNLVAVAIGSHFNPIKITITDGREPELCTVTFDNSAATGIGLWEQWPDVPRDVNALAKILNGETVVNKLLKYDLTAIPVLTTASLQVRVDVNNAQGTLANQVATQIYQGSASQWVAESPGLTLNFDGTRYGYLQKTTTDPNSALKLKGFDSTTGSLTLETWINPKAVPVTVLSHYNDSPDSPLALSRYRLDLSSNEIDVTFNNFTYHLNQGIPVNQWSHLAVTYHQPYGLKFAGDTDNYLDCGNNSSFNLQAPFTLEYFLLPTKYTMPLLEKKGCYSLSLNNGYLVFTCTDNNGKNYTCVSSAALSLNAFHKVAVVCSIQSVTTSQTTTWTDQDGKNQSSSYNVPKQVTQITFFIDGKPSDPQTLENLSDTSNKIRITLASNDNPLTLAKNFNGTITQVRIWNQARSSSEIAQPVNRDTSGLISYWAFTEGQGSIVSDSISGNNAQIKGTADWIACPDPNQSLPQFFINGIAVGSVTSSSDSNPVKTPEFDLGYHPQTKVYFQGLLEEVRIWKQERTLEQITDNLFGRLHEDKGDLIAYYPFGQLANQTNPQIIDESYSGNNLSISGSADYLMSTAPIASDIPLVSSVLGGNQDWAATISSSPAIQEYGEIETTLDNQTSGSYKRCYTYISDNVWYLITGFKIGSLISEWIGQIQYDPQVIGFIEGAPPVPGENLTGGTQTPGKSSYDGITSVNFVEAESVQYSFSSSADMANKNNLEQSSATAIAEELQTTVAPFGFGITIKAAAGKVSSGYKGKYEVSAGVSVKYGLTEIVNTNQNLKQSLHGYWQSSKKDLPTEDQSRYNDLLGRRFLPENSGLALVKSKTADVFALRLSSSHALVSFSIMPSPNIPEDFNLIPFPINPTYTKQGTLDGRVGYNPDGSVFYDPDYANASSYGEYSYFKPTQAYRLKKKIEQEYQELLAYYSKYNTTLATGLQLNKLDIETSSGGTGLGTDAISNTTSQAQTNTDKMLSISGIADGISAGINLLSLVPGINIATGGAADLLTIANMGMIAAQARQNWSDNELPSRFAKKDLVNTYVWTASGGFYEESTQNTDTVSETYGGSFTDSSAAGGESKFEGAVMGFASAYALSASTTTNLNLSMSKTKESKDTYQLQTTLNVPSNLQQYTYNDDCTTANPVYENGKPKFCPGKVDAYRYMSFYLAPTKDNFVDLFNQVIDPLWLNQSNDANAVALRSAHQAGATPPCWRIMHRVTFVSRVLPEIDPKVTVTDPEQNYYQAMNQSQITSNYELIKLLEPFVAGNTANMASFNKAVVDALNLYYPSLLPYQSNIIQFMANYFNVPQS